MSGESILVVCAANVCRSPLAEIALRRALGPDSGITVSSAGVRATPGDTICTMVAALRDDADWRERTSAHSAREVTAEMIEHASIVLAASREIRGELVRMAPRSRDWMFTIKEAAHLGSGFSSSASDRVVEYVAHLDRARSKNLPLAPPAGIRDRMRRLVAGTTSTDPSSIADRHNSRGHRDTVAEVESSIAVVAAQLSGHRRHG